ncbi:MAG: exo-alpha-sialidase [Saprospiraceae bacterium]|nr:exo-alpha-sialidase [Saprospiraceae bacterium]
MKALLIVFLFTLSAMWGIDSLAFQDQATPVFSAGEGEYACFRIPAVIKTTNGNLLAFAEGRKNGCSDTGDIDLVMKRSTDDGRTWSQLQVIWEDGTNTCGNPAPVVEKSSGDIILLSTWNLGSDREPQIIEQQSTDTRRVFLLRSDDDGHTWSQPKEITAQVKDPTWTWYATGPGSGIQMVNGPFEGRLVVGCDHIEAGTKKYYSHAVYSDDGGHHWNLGGSSPQDQVNECEVAELADGRLIMNMRNYDRNQKSRQVMFSDDGGITWTGQKHDEALVEPICQASLLRHEDELVFSNPASPDKRERMTLKVSGDDGRTWDRQLILHEGPAAYSDLVSLAPGRIGCLFEAGEESPYERIVFLPVEMDRFR